MSLVNHNNRGADIVIKTTSGGYRGTVEYQGRTYMNDSTPIDLIDWAKGIVGDDIVIEFGKGDFTLEDELVVNDSRTVIRGQGMDVTELILADSINKDVIDITGARYVNVKIHDLKLNGNKTNNPTGGDCINGLIAAGAVPESMGWWLQIWNVRCYNAKDKGMDIGMTTTPASPQTLIYNVRSYDNDGTPEIFFDNLYDSLFYGLWASSIHWDGGCTKSKISNVYVGGGGSMCKIGGDQILATNLGIDQVPNGAYALRVYGDGNTVHCHCSNKLNTEAGQDAIRISGVANYIKAHFTDDAFAGGGATYQHLFSEAGGSDWNLCEYIEPYVLNTAGGTNFVGGNSVGTKLI